MQLSPALTNSSGGPGAGTPDEQLKTKEGDGNVEYEKKQANNTATFDEDLTPVLFQQFSANSKEDVKRASIKRTGTLAVHPQKSDARIRSFQKDRLNSIDIIDENETTFNPLIEDEDTCNNKDAAMSEGEDQN